MKRWFAALLVLAGCRQDPTYVVVADAGERSAWGRAADSFEDVSIEPGTEVDFVTAAAGDDLIVRPRSAGSQDRRWRVPRRNLRHYSTGLPLSP